MIQPSQILLFRYSLSATLQGENHEIQNRF